MKKIKELKNVILIVLLTVFLLGIYYYFLKVRDEKYEYGVFILLTFIILIVSIYFKKINFSINFDVLFFKYLIFGLVLMLFLALMFGDRFINNPNKLKKFLTLNFFVAPLFEELFFRFLFFEKLKNFSTNKVIILTSLMFAISHWYSQNGLFYIFIFGLILAIYYSKRKSVSMVFLMHLIWNIVGTFFEVSK